MGGQHFGLRSGARSWWGGGGEGGGAGGLQSPPPPKLHLNILRVAYIWGNV